MNKTTQQDRLLHELRKQEWTPLPYILDLHIASYTRRIHELRKRGYVIETRIGKNHHTAYKLVSEPGGQNATQNIHAD